MGRIFERLEDSMWMSWEKKVSHTPWWSVWILLDSNFWLTRNLGRSGLKMCRRILSTWIVSDILPTRWDRWWTPKIWFLSIFLVAYLILKTPESSLTTSHGTSQIPLPFIFSVYQLVSLRTPKSFSCPRVSCSFVFTRLFWRSCCPLPLRWFEGILGFWLFGSILGCARDICRSGWVQDSWGKNTHFYTTQHAHHTPPHWKTRYKSDTWSPQNNF